MSEERKSLAEVEALCAALAGQNLPRDGFVVAVGGGVLTDLAGFAAAIYLRGVPWVSVIFAFAVGMIVFLPFPGWQKLVAFITSATVIIYAAQCLSMAAMRHQLPDRPRPFRLPVSP